MRLDWDEYGDVIVIEQYNAGDYENRWQPSFAFHCEAKRIVSYGMNRHSDWETEKCPLNWVAMPQQQTNTST